ncbi:hypothetical protein IFM89_031877 [Coptis chinensis]|uniref:Uncharacterized protein n=1 Tax=Coptis chinensis TaxID=261450 RepID=A0A835ISY0_9MAGN|nr:hypothetical protein IFM89_031877 [Coptis chinensis]
MIDEKSAKEQLHGMEILSIEGRHLSSGETQMAKKGLITSDYSVEDMGKDKVHGGNLDNSNVEGQKDYRPTIPGHSPGIGHAVVNRTTSPNV